MSKSCISSVYTFLCARHVMKQRKLFIRSECRQKFECEWNHNSGWRSNGGISIVDTAYLTRALRHLGILAKYHAPKSPVYNMALLSGGNVSRISYLCWTAFRSLFFVVKMRGNGIWNQARLSSSKALHIVRGTNHRQSAHIVAFIYAWNREMRWPINESNMSVLIETLSSAAWRYAAAKQKV